MADICRVSRVVVLIALGASVTACAVPQYSLRPYSISKAPSMSAEQAWAMCAPRAELEGKRARQAMQQRNAAERDRVTGYNCQTKQSPYSYGGNTYNSDCTAQTQGSGGFAGGFAAGMAEGNAYSSTRDMVFQSCMAEAGWGLKSVCVQNCK